MIYRCYQIILSARISVVGKVTRYGLDGPGIEIPVGARFSTHVQTGPGAHQASYTMGTGSLPGVKRPGRSVNHSPPSSAKVKEKVQLYIYSPSGPLGSVLRRTLPNNTASEISLHKSGGLRSVDWISITGVPACP